MITVKELVEQLSKYREDAIVTVRLGDDKDYPVIGHKVCGNFRYNGDDAEGWRGATIKFWTCSLMIDERDIWQAKN